MDIPSLVLYPSTLDTRPPLVEECSNDDVLRLDVCNPESAMVTMHGGNEDVDPIGQGFEPEEMDTSHHVTVMSFSAQAMVVKPKKPMPSAATPFGPFLVDVPIDLDTPAKMAKSKGRGGATGARGRARGRGRGRGRGRDSIMMEQTGAKRKWRLEENLADQGCEFFGNKRSRASDESASVDVLSTNVTAETGMESQSRQEP